MILSNNVKYRVLSISAGRYQNLVWTRNPNTGGDVFFSWGGDLR